MNLILRTSLIFLIVIFHFLTNTNGQGFRNYSWGTRKDVIISEEGEPVKDEYKRDFIIAYENIPILGINITHKTYFYFNDLGLLQSGEYHFEKATEEQSGILIKKLTSIYGPPQIGDFKIYWPYKTRFAQNKYSWKKGDTIILLGQSLTSEIPLYIQYYNGKFYQKQLGKERVGL